MTQRRIYSPVESDELFVKIANGFQSLIIFVKSSILDVRLGSEYTYCLLVFPLMFPYALCDLVPFAQFKKCEKQPWRSAAFSKVVG